MAIKPILMTDNDRERWRIPLLEYYRKKGLSEDEADKAIDSVFAESQAGWNRAPNDLDTRIKMKSGFQWKSHSNLKPKQKEDEEKITVDDDSEDYSGEENLTRIMTQSEKKWWGDRKDIYNRDFEFNDSSDKPLLAQLLLEELMQQRLFHQQLKYKDRDYNKKLSDSLKRVAELQTKLGITREQRAGIMNKIDGNVAVLAQSLDEKLKNMPKVIKEEYEEELYYKSLRDQRDPINILPPMEKMEALLNVDGKTSVNIDSSRISEISEEVAKEIKDKRERDLDKPPKKELSDGVEIDLS